MEENTRLCSGFGLTLSLGMSLTLKVSIGREEISEG